MNKQEEALREIATRVEHSLGKAYEQPMGFILVTAPFTAAAGVSDYIGNADRETVIKWMRETADRLEKNQTIPATEGNG